MNKERPKGRKRGSRNRGFSVYANFRHSSKFDVAWTDGAGKRRVLRSVKSRAVAVEIGKAKAAESDRVRGGVVTSHQMTVAEAATLDIEKHIDAWKQAMKHRGCNKHHYDPQTARVRKLCGRNRGCIGKLSDISPEKLQRAVALTGDMTSDQTARHYFGAFRAFIRWCIETGRLDRNPTLGAKLPKAAGQVFRRVPIPPEKLTDLINATLNAPDRANASGKRRALFYAVLAYTGLRKSEARSLTRESFDFDACIVTVEAGYSKNRKLTEQQLPPQFIELCADWVRAYRPGASLFPYSRSWHIERAFRLDCKDAGIVADANVEKVKGEVLGVHSLRRLFITQAIRGGGLAVAQRLARHSTPTLTAGYADIGIADYDKALAALPSVTTVQRKARTA